MTHRAEQSPHPVFALRKLRTRLNGALRKRPWQQLMSPHKGSERVRQMIWMLRFGPE